MAPGAVPGWLDELVTLDTPPAGGRLALRSGPPGLPGHCRPGARRTRTRTRTRPAPAPVPVPAEGAPACILVSEQEELIEQCAAIAVSAAVRITQCTPRQAGTADGGTPVLWGADQAAEILSPRPRCDVLVGTEAQSAQLWKLASRMPQARVAILPGAARWLGEYLGLWAMRSGHGHTLALRALAGGLGTSTLAFLVAHAGTLSGLRSLVVDLDPNCSGFWPRISRTVPSGVGWEQLHRSGGALAAHQLAETLPEVAGTAVLSWSRGVPEHAVDEQLAARVLAAARQGYDFLVLDCGRVSTHAQVLDQLVDRGVSLCAEGTDPPSGQYIVCGPRRVNLPRSDGGLLGAFTRRRRIERAAAGGHLADCLRSRALRQQLADLRLLPEPGADGLRGAP